MRIIQPVRLIRGGAIHWSGNFHPRGAIMPLFLIERNFAQEVIVDDAKNLQIKQINEEVGVDWLFSFLSADKRKNYCLYEAPSEEAILEAARRANVPADVIIPVGTIPIAEFRAEKYSVVAQSGS